MVEMVAYVSGSGGIEESGDLGWGGAVNGIEFTVDEDCTAGTFSMNLCLSRDHLPRLI